MTVLFDTSFLVALWSERDQYHERAVQAMQVVRTDGVIAVPLLTELFYMLASRIDYQTAVQGFVKLQSVAYRIQPLTAVDMRRMTGIMTQYADNRFDFVDTAIMALSERLVITEIYTFDRRDFSVFRPAHIAALRLFP